MRIAMKINNYMTKHTTPVYWDEALATTFVNVYPLKQHRNLNHVTYCLLEGRQK